MSKQLVRFDWAVKKLLRNKANFGILEGFLSELFKFDVKIETLLEGEGNKETEYDKFNRVDILVKNTKNEYILVEIQNDLEHDYFHRMLYGVSKLVTEYINVGEPYGTIRKVYSVNIVYFDLGQGEDYIYEYKGEFEGIHLKDTLLPTSRQKDKFNIQKVSDIFPKYYVLKINNFDDVAKTTLDEWIYFLKNSEVKDEFKAKGLDEVKKRMLYEKLSEEEKRAYNRFHENRRIEKSVRESALEDGRKEGKEEGMKEGKELGIKEGKEVGMKEGMNEAKIQIALNMIQIGLDDETIIKATNLSLEAIQKLRNKKS
jgi:predicted transposase/invertase (TIGR01784 family)